ncbi:MAG: 3D-(3,5/4)-trihydroxycyclohexane-1,2-dione acylhydrolase (decyclizing) [Betaproteobacteria bacterium]|nr:3D-(3,5/4)-trihydroxycyclohexane-1,2-dione acylhydrolase (decyclizing) [Betaproteobacteria bacterium]
MKTVRLTAAQAVVRYLSKQLVQTEAGTLPYFAGVWAIFGHGNVAGLGEALYASREQLPVYRAHNEQAMAHAAIAYAKQSRRRRAMICTTSIGPGATNMVTAAALAHVNRLPILFIPGDVFASRRPDPVLQQIEFNSDATLSANDCFRPVSRFFDRITRPEQVIDALPRAMSMLFDASQCGPATVAFCQDVQCEAFDYPAAFFEPHVWRFRKQPADPVELDHLASLLKACTAPLIIAGGGVRYSDAEQALDDFARATGIPVGETQAGKGSLVWDHPGNLGSIGVTGTSAANSAAQNADLIIGIGTRLQDFTTGSRALFAAEGRMLAQINTSDIDAHKHGAVSVMGDAGTALVALQSRLAGWRAPAAWAKRLSAEIETWNQQWTLATSPLSTAVDRLPSDAQVVGAVWRQATENAVVVCAAGGLPGELHKLWRTRAKGGYHVEYGYSCMGYEIAGGLGAKMAEPDRDVYVMVGDGSYLMMNSEIATSVMLGMKLTIVVLDNRGFGCINRLQQATGSAPFNNLLVDSKNKVLPDIDFAAHAASMGANARKVDDIAGLDAAMAEAKNSDRTFVIVIDTDPAISTQAGGTWWDVAVPEVSSRPAVAAARAAYDEKIKQQRTGD